MSLGCPVSAGFSPYATRVPRSPVQAKFPLLQLPYKTDALEPYMSRKTLELHWQKHMGNHTDNLNRQIQDTELEGYLLEDLIWKTYNRGNPLPAFNSASEVYNHYYFFHGMKPEGGEPPTGEIAELINVHFGTFENFVREFKLAANSQFGSGWAWLAIRRQGRDVKLMVQKTPNAFNPLVYRHTPLLNIDVWEHAYYLDYENRRSDYVDMFLEKLVNWEAVNNRLEQARGFMNWGGPDWKVYNKDADILDEEHAVWVYEGMGVLKNKPEDSTDAEKKMTVKD